MTPTTKRLITIYACALLVALMGVLYLGQNMEQDSYTPTKSFHGHSNDTRPGGGGYTMSPSHQP